MTNDLQFEAEVDGGEPPKEWGLHNGVVVVVALALVALSVFLDWIRNTELFDGTPVWVNSFVSSLGLVLMVAAGCVIGMLVATRMLQAHVSPQGAKVLALWGAGAMVLALMLQTVLLALNLRLQESNQVTILAAQSLGNFVAGTVAVGAAMIALGFVGRLRGRQL